METGSCWVTIQPGWVLPSIGGVRENEISVTRSPSSILEAPEIPLGPPNIGQTKVLIKGIKGLKTSQWRGGWQ